MISLDRASYQVQPRYAEYAGLSTDIKPVEVDNGDEFQEIDTGFVYKFNAETSEWVKQPTSGGGGGGTNDYNDLINLPQINGVELIGNKTSADFGLESGYEWRLIRTVTAPEDPTTDQSGVTWEVSEDGNIFGFSFDTDQNGLPFEAEEVVIGGTGDFYPNSGTRTYMYFYYDVSSFFRFYDGIYQGLNVRFTMKQNKITDTLSNPVATEQKQYQIPPATIILPYGNANPFYELNSPVWNYFRFTSNNQLYYMENFTFNIYGRFKK